MAVNSKQGYTICIMAKPGLNHHKPQLQLQLYTVLC